MAAKVVPERNALKPTPLSKQPLLLDNRDPAFVYEAFSTDPSHPGYIGRKLVKHQVGDAETGFAVVEPWEVCTVDNDPALKLRNTRDDQGKPIDTAHRHGDLIWCRTTRENHAKYAQVHDARTDLNGKGLTRRETQSFGTGGTSAGMIVSNSEEATTEQVMKGLING